MIENEKKLQNIKEYEGERVVVVTTNAKLSINYVGETISLSIILDSFIL